MKGRLVLAMTVALLLCGCGEKRVDGPTAPTQTVEATVHTVVEEPVLVTLPEETVPETQPETESAETAEVPVPRAEGRPRPGKLIDPKDQDLVLVTDYLTTVTVDLRYAGPDNFTGKKIYDFQEAYLRYGTVKKLENVCRELETHGLSLKIWDAFRPHQAQYTLWEVCPDARYVANPERGYSAHTRGNAVDITLVDSQGREVEMPTGFDDFSAAADRDYSDCTEEAAKNAMLLETIMEKHGFSSYWGEWWHYVDRTQYEVETVYDPEEFSRWTPDCEEYITLRSKADARSEPVNRIALGEEIVVLGFTGRFAMADYLGQRGYVLYKYIKPLE